MLFLSPIEQKLWRELCREHGQVVSGMFERGEADLIEYSPLVRHIRRQLDWWEALNERRYLAEIGY